MLTALLLCTACLSVPRGSRIDRAAGPLPAQENIAVVEFDDDGFALEPRQTAAALAHVDTTIRRLSIINADATAGQANSPVRTRRSVLVLTFTHGWHNNADTSRGNFVRFRELVRSMRAALAQGYAADVAGAKPGETVDSVVVLPVYLAWRGQLLKGVLDNVTFWSRKRVAERVGVGEYAVLVRALNERRRRWARDVATERNMLVHTGHSFGGGALLSATLPSLAQHLGSFQSSEEEPAPPADLIVALNPAIEANVLNRSVLSGLARARTESRASAANAAKGSAATRVAARPTATPSRLVVLDSDNDAPRHRLFPIGRRTGAFPYLWTIAAMSATYALTRQHDDWRWATAVPLAPALYVASRSVEWTAGEAIVAGRPRSQRNLRADTLASDAELRCWTIRALDGVPVALRALAAGAGRDANDACENQVKVIAVAPQIIWKHSEIWRPANTALIRELLMRNVREHAVQVDDQRRRGVAPSQQPEK